MQGAGSGVVGVHSRSTGGQRGVVAGAACVGAACVGVGVGAACVGMGFGAACVGVGVGVFPAGRCTNFQNVAMPLKKHKTGIFYLGDFRSPCSRNLKNVVQ